jgi:O-antigen ligase
VKNNLERKLSFVAIPIVLMLLDYSKWDVEKWAVRGFLAGLAITGLHMLFLAAIKILSGTDLQFWSYHEFTKPYSIGAIYYSLYLSSAIFYLFFRNPEPVLIKFKPVLISFFLLLLLICASKFFIGFTLPVVLWQFLIKIKSRNGALNDILAIAVISGIIIASVPFYKRLLEIKNTDFKVVSQNEFSYDTPFNGLNFRLLQWRLAVEILDEQNAWLYGTGIGSKQILLNKKYKQYGIYTGNPDLGDTGYLNYNYHNQYLETLAGTGITGLILLFLIIFYIFAQNRRKLFFPSIVFLLIILFFIFESVLDRQVGIVFFCLAWFLSIKSSTATYGSNIIADTE